MRIRSCRDHKDTGRRVSGYYTIIDGADNPYQVFCNFVRSYAWTLIQSYSLENKDKFDKPFIVDHPLNENNSSWVEYRLSKIRMEYISHAVTSTRWRITCNYNTEKLKGSDLVRARVDQAPVFINAGKRCFTFEYISIRGYGCNNCQAFMANDGIQPLYFDLKRSEQDCGLNIPNIKVCNNTETETSFGYYRCINPIHRCSSSPNSTTQMWLD